MSDDAPQPPKSVDELFDALEAARYQIGETIHIRVYSCSHCDRMINENYLVGHLLFTHDDADGARRALERLIARAEGRG